MAKRISSKNEGQVFTLALHSRANGPWILDAELLRVFSDEHGERSEFHAKDGSGTFELYRFQGRWSWGSSADRVSVVK